jgi:hypothetical protein
MSTTSPSGYLNTQVDPALSPPCVVVMEAQDLTVNIQDNQIQLTNSHDLRLESSLNAKEG